MKKKVLTVILFILMLLALVGLFVEVVNNIDAILSVFHSQSVDASKLIYIEIAIILACWTVLFVIFVREKSNGSVLDYGKKDALTGIGNKKYLKSKYEKTSLDYNQLLCLSYISFDTSIIAQRYDVNLCEKLQKGLAQLLTENCNESDADARISNGTFAFIMRCRDGIHAEHRMIEILNKLNKYEHQVLFEHIAPIRAGLYICDDNNIPFAKAFGNAELAYDFACTDKVNTLVYTDDLIAKKEVKGNLESKFLSAMENNEFETFLQFVYDVRMRKFTGAEVLSRWNSPEDGFLMPAYYINDMYTSGVIERFDMYMLDKVCALLQKWSEDDKFSSLMLSCNITRVTISSENFLDNFRKIIKKYKFDRHLLILEITEDALIDDRAIAYHNIVESKSEGIQIILDDFGAGSSSFSDIGNYPVDQIKVDRQFVARTTTQRGSALLHGLVDLAHHLDIKVVCEGVETSKQMDVAIQSNCDYIQGYYYSYVFSVEEGKEYYLKSLQ